MAISTAVMEKVKRFDGALRLRECQGPDPMKPGQSCTMVALERRRRDGVYARIGWVRPDLLGDGSVLLNKLKRNDVREYGSGAKAATAYDEAEAKETRARKDDRKDEFTQIGKAAYETHIKRRTGERISNAGMPGVSA